MSNRARLADVMGRIKVWELARLAGASVEQVIAVVVRAASLPDFSRLAPTDAGRAAALATLRGRVAPPTDPPPLAELVGRATLRELDVVVDRWVLALVLHEHDWNVTHAAARLAISRRALRGRWAKIRDLPLVAAGTQPSPSPPEPPSPGLILSHGGTLADVHDAARRWFVERTLERTGGNLTHAALALKASRRFVRALRDADRG